LAGNPAFASGARSTGVGVSSQAAALGGADCSSFGYQSLTLNTANQNSAFGSSSLAANVVGVGNSAFGYNSGLLCTGGGNAFFGTSSGSAITNTNNNVCIANTGTLGDVGTMRIGTSGTHTKNFQAAIRSVTADLADSSPVYVTSTGQLTSVSTSNGSGSIFGTLTSLSLTTSTWTLLTGVTNSIATMQNFDRPADNRLRYTGNNTTNVMVNCCLSIQANSTTNLFVALTKNGATPSSSFAGLGGISVTTGNNVNFSPQGCFSMSQNDYISAWVFSTTASPTSVSGSYCTISGVTC
jgi:hypothetical protein